MSVEQPTAIQCEIANAKAQLLKDGTYERLVSSIKMMLNGEATTLTHSFIKDELTNSKNTSDNIKIKDVRTESLETKKSKNSIKIFKPSSNPSPLTVIPDIVQNQRYFSQGGYGLGGTETSSLYHSIKLFLSGQKNIGQCRFWGKVLGLKNNYYILECIELEITVPKVNLQKDEVETRDGTPVDVDETPLPKSSFVSPPTIPSEFKFGPNRAIYFAATCLDGNFAQLPDVTPGQILTSRKITKFFTGDLSAKVHSFPNFVGDEASLLRAQIARISSSTIVAPTGYLQGGGEEEEEEDGDDSVVDFPGQNKIPKQNDLIPAEEIEKISATGLLELDSWQHVRQALSQGQARTKYWKAPKPEKVNGEEEEEEEEDEAEEEDEVDELALEDIPPMLREISSDGKNMDEEEEESDQKDQKMHWTTKLSSKISRHPVAFAVSNIWPGAVTFACGERFESVYIGFGCKSELEMNYEPETLPEFQIEGDLIEHAVDCVEMMDPNVEEETQLRERLQGGDEAEDDEDGDEEGEEEEEEDDE